MNKGREKGKKKGRERDENENEKEGREEGKRKKKIEAVLKNMYTRKHGCVPKEFLFQNRPLSGSRAEYRPWEPVPFKPKVISAFCCPITMSVPEESTCHTAGTRTTERTVLGNRHRTKK